MITVIFFILGLPLAAFAFLRFFGGRTAKAHWISLFAGAGSFALSVSLFAKLWIAKSMAVQVHWLWFSVNTSEVNVGFSLDVMSVTMLLLVSTISLVVQIFSTAYLEPQHFSRYFCYLSLFTAAMLALVVSDNMLTFFMAWELMGICSYLLIGFNFHRSAANRAALKAFLAARVGDTALIISIVAMYHLFGTVGFSEMYLLSFYPEIGEVRILGYPALTFICFTALLGTVGKAAQFPLHVWLPDAMEGPTPVSALIHAATMVAAGVFLLFRLFPLLLVTPSVLEITGWLGVGTALLASYLAFTQFDIKKILAYSTISQLGLMLVGVSVGSLTAPFLHLVTHAFFKAGLFLGAGSLIHGTGTQDLREMGGLRKSMRVTFACMTVFTFAICGIPFFSGYVSKDRILEKVFERGLENGEWGFPIFCFLLVGFTAFYMFRFWFLIFFGRPPNQAVFKSVHESPRRMTVPLLILALFSLGFWYGPFIERVMAEPPSQFLLAAQVTPYLSLILTASGILIATAFYGRNWLPHPEFRILFSLDRVYSKVIDQSILPFARGLARFDNRFLDHTVVDGLGRLTLWLRSLVGKFDDVILDGLLVDGTARLPGIGGSVLGRMQTGRVQRYLLWMVLGLLGIAVFLR